MHFLNGVSVLIVGLGESGLACAQFAHLHGATVTVADTRAQAPNHGAVQAMNAVRVVLGELNEALLNGITQVVMSPGLSPHQTDVAALLAAAQAQHIAVCSEIDWFGQALAELNTSQSYAPTVLAITGTNGKTTVTELTTHLCNEAGVSAIACGNIGPAALAALMTAMQANSLPDVWVLELSSFQLHYTQVINPKAATVLNLTQDHLDWHSDMVEYAADKTRIFGANTLRILNRDDASTMAMAGDVAASRAGVQTFGIQAPLVVGDVGCVHEGGLNWLVQAQLTELERKRRKADLIETHTQRLMPADALRIRGSHNHANALAALLLVQAAGVNISKALHGLRSFKGAAHRCESVHIVDDVEYINDSKGTNVGATIAALHGLGEGRQRLVLIAGGVGKGQDFTPLCATVKQSCKAVILIGEATSLLIAALAPSSVPLSAASDLNAAVIQASQLCKAGDAVLLSPACASFDMFKNYAQRGQLFVQAVQALALDRGQAC
jgi:UDP-N-acetylmuramoylalanine--D-glutamate ligase